MNCVSGRGRCGMELNFVHFYVGANGLDCRAEGSDGAANEEHGRRSCGDSSGGGRRRLEGGKEIGRGSPWKPQATRTAQEDEAAGGPTSQGTHAAGPHEYVDDTRSQATPAGGQE
jgi:hypothetical protein